MNTEKTWRETEQDLATTFSKWGVREWEASSNVLRSRHAVQTLSPDERRATVKWKSPGGTLVVLTMDRHATPPDNLRVLYLGIEALRLNELRQISDIVGEAYKQLAAPTTRAVDPWALLGLTPTASPLVARAAWRALANENHPDKGGDAARFAEINAAWEQIKGTWDL